MKCLLVLCFIFNVGHQLSTADDLPGHMKPLGEQHESMGHIEVIEDIPSPQSFFNDYIKASKPVVFKNAAKQMAAYKLWTDEYLMERFGDVVVDVEEGKKENRSLAMWNWKFKDFLNTYKTSDVYMVHSLPKQMRNDLRLFPSLSCGGFTNVLTDVIMWFSSGGTKSVLHNDHIDNINCLFSGTKTLYMVDYKYREHVVFDSPQGAFSNVDVDAVDVKKYPGLTKAPWWRADMQAGDCLFIPSRWFHQVRSFTDNNKNMAVNVWFYNMKKINNTECEEIKEQEVKSLGDFPVMKEQSSTQAAIRFLLHLDVDEKPLSYKEMYRKLKEHSGGERLDRQSVIQVLKVLDHNKDGAISIDDVDKLSVQDLRVVAPLYAGLAIEGEGEDEEEGEDGEQDERINDEL